MKIKLFFIICVCLFANLLNGQISIPKAEKLGIVAELAYLKLTSENLVLFVLDSKDIDTTKKKKIVVEYNKLRVMSDQIVLQLISDMKRKNSIKFYRKLDNIFKSKTISNIQRSDSQNKRVKSYIENIKKLNKIYQELFNIKFTDEEPVDIALINPSSLLPSSANVEEITGFLTFVTSTIKNIRESKEKKVEKISTILNDLRLKAPQDLKSPKKKEEKKGEKD